MYVTAVAMIYIFFSKKFRLKQLAENSLFLFFFFFGKSIKGKGEVVVGGGGEGVQGGGGEGR